MSDSDNDPNEAKYRMSARDDEGRSSPDRLKSPDGIAENLGMEDAGAQFQFDAPSYEPFHFIRSLGGAEFHGISSLPWPTGGEFASYTLIEQAYGQAVAFERSLIGGSGSLDDFGKIMAWVYNDLITQKSEKSDT